jgi:PAS domain S-box-containing protein
MTPQPREKPATSGKLRYVVALAAFLGGFLLRFALTPLIGLIAPFITFFPAVIIAARYGGLGAGLAVTGLGAIASLYFFIAPTHSLVVTNRGDALSLLVFIGVSSFISWISHGQRRLAGELDKQKRWFEHTLAGIGDAVIATDRSGRIQFLNPIAADLTGWPVSEAIDQPLQNVLGIVDEHTHAPIDNAVERAIKEGAATASVNDRALISRAGKETPIEDTAAPIRDEQGAIVGAVLVFRDITQRKLAQSALEAAHAETARILESTKESFAAIDRDWTFTYVNAQAARITGCSREEMVGKNVWEVFPLRVGGQSYIQMHRAMNDRTVATWISHFKHGDLWYESTAYPAEQGISLFIRDITPRKRAERQLRSTESRLRRLMESGIIGVMSLDKSGVMREVNDALINLIGYSREELLDGKMRWNDLAATDYRQADAEAMAEADRRGACTPYEKVCVRKDGRKVPLLIGYALLEEPETDYICFVLDITPQKNAELRAAELLEREQEARRTAELLNRACGILSAQLDLEKLVQSATDIAAELTGAQMGAFFYNVVNEQGESYTLYGLSGVPRAAFAGFPMPRNTAIFGPTFRGEGVVRFDDVTQESRYGHNSPYAGMPAGHPAVKSYLAAPVVSRSSDVIGGMFFGHADAGRFTEEHERLLTGICAQAAIAIDNARLFEAAEAARREALRTNEALARTNAELQQFAFVASHDLQEPLRTISSFTQLLAKRYQGNLGEDADQYIQYTVGAAKRMAELIADLLSFSRLGSESEVEKSETDCEAVFARSLENLRFAIQETHAIITHDALPVLQADAARLCQVFQNIIGNAIKYRSGEVPQIHVSALKGPGEWIFSIRDNGIGIDSGYTERIFGLFKRLHGSDYPGTGLGLAICKKIVEQHGGRIWVESKPGAGSAFYFSLPFAIQ